MISVQAVNSLAHLQALPWAALRPQPPQPHTLATVCPQASCEPCAHLGCLQPMVHKPFFPSTPSTLFLHHPTLTAFCPCARASACRWFMSLFLSYIMKTLFQLVFLTLQKAAVTQFRLTAVMGTSMLNVDIYLITKVRGDKAPLSL